MTALPSIGFAGAMARRLMLAGMALASATAWPATTQHHGINPRDMAALDVDPRSHALLETVKTLDNWRGITEVALAPDGAHAALIGWNGQLLLMDTATLSAIPLRSSATSNHSALAAHWLDPQHLIVDWSNDESLVMGLQGERGRRIGKRVVRMALGADGTLDGWAIVSDNGLFDDNELHRVNARTGEESKVPLGLGDHLVQLVFDRRGRVRAALTRDSNWLSPGNVVKVWYRHDDAAPWQLVRALPVSAYVEGWQLAGVDDAADQLLVTSREGRDTWALFRLDPATQRLGDLVIGDPDADLESGTQTAQGMPLRAVTSGLKRSTRWLDPRWARLQRSVDKALPCTTNELLSGDPDGAVLIYAHSDRDPGQWLMLDAVRRKLVPLGRRSLAIAPDDMRPMQTLDYDAPDGLKIPAYLTLPAGPEVPRPMVVLLHGGPTYRDQWRFNSDVQLFAAAGYAVFQPQFRGSTGFGKAFEVAGYRQWGRAMQDDVTAGVKAMIARGVADPDRICIYGASYGGYAAMWGLARTPELYKCGITLSGVSDIGEMFTDWSDINDDDEARAIARFRIGDPRTMQASFDEVSPTLHADRIRAPVLIGHGTEDKRVPEGHARRLEQALDDAHRPVDAHFYVGEGHGLGGKLDHEHFTLLAVSFVDRNIGPASAVKDRWVPVPVAPAPAASAASVP